MNLSCWRFNGRPRLNGPFHFFDSILQLGYRSKRISEKQLGIASASRAERYRLQILVHVVGCGVGFDVAFKTNSALSLLAEPI